MPSHKLIFASVSQNCGKHSKKKSLHSLIWSYEPMRILKWFISIELHCKARSLLVFHEAPFKKVAFFNQVNLI